MARAAEEPAGEGQAAPRVAVLGCGALGSALARELAAGGTALLLWSREIGRAEALAGRLEGLPAELAVEPDARRALGEADLTLIAVADDALESFAADLAEGLEERDGEPTAVLHTNGTLGPEALAPLAGRGFATGKLHPLAAVPPEGGGEPGRFRGTWFAIAGDPVAEASARWVAEKLGARPLALAGEDAAALLHAAAALLAGGTVALFDLAADAAARAAREPEEGRAALAALLATTAANLERAPDAAQALTGPVARGASELVRRHLDALDPEAREAYRLLARRMLELGVARGTVDAVAARALERLLRR